MHYLNSVLTPTQRGEYCLSFPKYKDTGIWRVEALPSGAIGNVNPVLLQR